MAIRIQTEHVESLEILPAPENEQNYKICALYKIITHKRSINSITLIINNKIIKRSNTLKPSFLRLFDGNLREHWGVFTRPQ
jgi:hypothetical protein